MISNNESRERLFEILYTRSFLYRADPPFKLTSGKVSPYYFDCKATTLDPEGCNIIGGLMFQVIRDLNIDAIGGLTLGADPVTIATSLEAYRNGERVLPLIVRKEPKSHGTQMWVEGNLKGVSRVVVIEDVITTGKSALLAVKRMSELGLEVVMVAAIIDREEGGRESIINAGVDVISIFKRQDFDKKRLEDQKF